MSKDIKLHCVLASEKSLRMHSSQDSYVFGRAREEQHGFSSTDMRAEHSLEPCGSVMNKKCLGDCGLEKPNFLCISHKEKAQRKAVFLRLKGIVSIPCCFHLLALASPPFSVGFVLFYFGLAFVVVVVFPEVQVGKAGKISLHLPQRFLYSII